VHICLKVIAYSLLYKDTNYKINIKVNFSWHLPLTVCG